MDVKEGLKEEQQITIERDNFWGNLIAFISILDGMFILYHRNYITDRLDEYFMGIDENIFGWLLVIFGVLKFIGIRIKSRHMRAVAIVGLSVVWGMLFTVSILWSFGIGYPSNAFLTNGLMLVVCLRVAYKGIFNGLD